MEIREFAKISNSKLNQLIRRVEILKPKFDMEILQDEYITKELPLHNISEELLQKEIDNIKAASMIRWTSRLHKKKRAKEVLRELENRLQENIALLEEIKKREYNPIEHVNFKDKEHFETMKELDIVYFEGEVEFLERRINEVKNELKTMDRMPTSFVPELEYSMVKRKASKYDILVYLYYHFCFPKEIGEHAFVLRISEKQVANDLGCTIQTVRNCNERLIEAGLIEKSNAGDGFFNVLILDYKAGFAKGGDGYLELDKNTLFNWCEYDVNSLRMKIRIYMQHERDRVVKKYQKKHKSAVTRFDLQSTVASLLSYPKQLKKLVEKIKAPFRSIAYRDDTIVFELSKKHDVKVKKEKKTNEKMKRLKQWISLVQKNPLRPLKEANIEPAHIKAKSNVLLQEKELKNLAQLSLEYSMIEVVDGIKQYLYKSLIDGETIHNIGGFIRISIEKNRSKTAFFFQAS